MIISVTDQELRAVWAETQRGIAQGDRILFWMWLIVLLGGIAVLTWFIRFVWYL